MKCIHVLLLIALTILSIYNPVYSTISTVEMVYPRINESKEQSKNRIEQRESGYNKALGRFKGRKQTIAKNIKRIQDLEVKTINQSNQARKKRLSMRKKRKDVLLKVYDDKIKYKTALKNVHTPKVVKSSLNRVKSLSKLAIQSHEKRKEQGSSYIRFTEKEVQKYLLEGPRYSTVALLIAAKTKYPPHCDICRKIAREFYTFADNLADTQLSSWNATSLMAVNDATVHSSIEGTSLINVPSNIYHPSGEELPVFAVELDLEDNGAIFAYNEIQSAPSIIIFPPTVSKAKDYTINNFLKLPPREHRPILSNTLNAVELQSFVTKLVGGESATITAIQSKRNPVTEVFGKFPAHIWMLGSVLVVVLAAQIMWYYSSILYILTFFKMGLALLLMFVVSFNCSGGFLGNSIGIFPKTLLEKFTFSNLLANPRLYIKEQFREQYFGEGLMVSGTFMLCSFLSILLIEFAQAKNSKKSLLLRCLHFLSLSPGRPNTYLTKDITTVTMEKEEDDFEPYKDTNIVFKIINFIIFGVLIPACLFISILYLFFLLEFAFSIKYPAYLSDVMKSHIVVSKFVNYYIKMASHYIGISLPTFYKYVFPMPK